MTGQELQTIDKMLEEYAQEEADRDYEDSLED